MNCPRCRRPVAVARRQCLYCGADVSALAPAAKDTGPRPVEIDPAAFDFGAPRARESSLLEIAGWITALAAAAAVDDEFRRISPALAPAAPAAGAAAGPEDALRTSATRAPAILDNVAQFRFYSAWRGAVERQVRPR